MEVVLSPLQAQPARDGGEGGDEQETHHVAEERPFLVARTRVPQPLWGEDTGGRGSQSAPQVSCREPRGREDEGRDRRYLGEGPRPALDAELGVAELAVAGVGGREPLLQAAPVHRAQRPRAVARRQQGLATAALVANAADGTVAEGRRTVVVD